MARRLVERESGGPPSDGPAEPLTPRKLEVLRLIARGHGNAEIAAALFITPATVRTHITHILAKLHVTRRTQAALYAVRHGIAPAKDGETAPASTSPRPRVPRCSVRSGSPSAGQP